MHRIHTAIRMIIALSAAAGLALAQTENSDVLRVEAGGTRAVQSEDGSVTKWLSAGLRAWQGDVVLTAQEGVLYSRPVRIVIHGDAVFRDSTRTIRGDTLMYYEETREAFAIGGVVAESPGRTLSTDLLHYRRLENLVNATGSVAVIDDSLRASMSGHAAVFNDSTRYGLITGNPVLSREDDDGRRMTITCDDTIEVIRSEDVARLWPNVVMTRDSLTAYADLAVYRDGPEEVVLSGSPVMEYLSVDMREDDDITLTTTSVVSGDTIRIYLSDREFAGAEIIGNVAGEITSVDSAGALYDRTIIQSNTMQVVMTDDVITLISAAGMAESYYHRRAVGSTRMFVNVASGDTLNFHFDEGRLDNLRIFGSGGGLGRGKYYSYVPEPENAEADTTVDSSGQQVD